MSRSQFISECIPVVGKMLDDMLLKIGKKLEKDFENDILKHDIIDQVTFQNQTHETKYFTYTNNSLIITIRNIKMVNKNLLYFRYHTDDHDLVRFNSTPEVNSIVYNITIEMYKKYFGDAHL